MVGLLYACMVVCGKEMIKTPTTDHTPEAKTKHRPDPRLQQQRPTLPWHAIIATLEPSRELPNSM